MERESTVAFGCGVPSGEWIYASCCDESIVFFLCILLIGKAWNGKVNGGVPI